MKKWLFACLIAAGTFMIASCGNQTYIVKVGTETINEDELFEQTRDYSYNVLATMIENEMLRQAYPATDKEVEKEIKNMMKNYKDETEFYQAMEQYGIKGKEAVFEFVRDNLSRYKAIGDGVKVTDQELKAYYEKNKTDKFTTIDASHILVETKKEAEDILKKLKKGESFSELAKKYSIDSSAENGGKLGEFRKGQMVEAFEKAAFALKQPGELSGVVKTEYGYHIIKLNKIHILDFEKDKEEIKREYLMENGKTIPEVMIELLKKQKDKIVIYDKRFNEIKDYMIEQYEGMLSSNQNGENENN